MTTKAVWLKNTDRTAICWKDETITYRDLLLRSAAVADIYKVNKGDRAIIYAENRPEWVLTMYANIRHEAITVPVDYLSPADELGFIVRQTEPVVIFCSDKTLPVVKEVLDGQDTLTPRIINFDRPDFPAATPESLEPTAIHAGEADEVFAILFTSGTTGAPKGAMLTYRNAQTNLQAVCDDIPIFTAKARTFALLPLHHVLPLLGSMIAPLYAQGTVIMAHTLDPSEMVATIRKQRATIMIGVPRLYTLISKAIMDNLQASAVGRLLYKISAKVNKLAFARWIMFPVQKKFGGRLRQLVSGGAALDYPIARQLTTLGFEVMEGYGMTECAPMITFPRPGTERLGACGQPCVPDSVRIEEGEILVRGPHVFAGYWRNEEATAEAIQDGWLHTGDLGYLDQDEYLFITGRKKEIIVLPNGKKINPVEIEEKLMSLDSNIRELAVTARDGLLHALILPTPGFLEDIPAAQSEHFRWRLLDTYNRMAPPAKKITRLTILTGELPKTRLGKIKRYELSALAVGTYTKAATESAAAAPKDDPVYSAFEQFLKHDLDCRDVYPSSHWEMDLALDSISRVSLLVFIEKTFGIKLDESIFRDHPTLLSLVRYVDKNKLYQEEVPRAALSLFDPEADTPLDLPKSRWIHPFLRTFFGIGLRLYFRVRCTGRENLPTTGQCILAPNHQSFIDGLFVSMYLPIPLLRKTFYYAKKKHVKDGLLMSLANNCNVIMVDVDKDVKLSLQKLAHALKTGNSLILFPEGTRTIDGQLGDFKPTFAQLAKELNVPIVPVAISGAYEALPRGGRMPRLGTKVSVQFLPPVAPEAGMDEYTLSETVREEIAKHIS